MKRSPFALLCALLLVTLRQRPADPALAAALARPGIDWPRLVTLSGVHLLTPALAPALGDPALRPHVPEDLLFYLDAMLTAATERNLALRHQLEEVAACLNAVEVIPVVLKGGARLIDDLWPDPSLRFMHDLDLLVPEQALPACRSRLAQAGWRPVDDGVDHGDHHLVLVHPRAPARIELHPAALPAPHADLLPAARMLARAVPTAIGTALVALPAAEDQLVHLVAHGMLHHQFLRNGRFLLRDVVERHLLAARAGPAVVAAARERFAAAGAGLAWDVAAELDARCLGGDRVRRSRAAQALALRMLLQQRGPAAMLVLGPLGWLAASLCAGQPGDRTVWAPRSLTGRLTMFYRKTRW